MGDGDHDQGDEEPEPVASSTSDATSGTRRSRLAFRSVVSALLSGWETFLHSLKAVLGPAARGAAGDGGPAGTPTHALPTQAISRWRIRSGAAALRPRWR
jgi:hypothetical protein